MAFFITRMRSLVRDVNQCHNRGKYDRTRLSPRAT